MILIAGLYEARPGESSKSAKGSGHTFLNYSWGLLRAAIEKGSYRGSSYFKLVSVITGFSQQSLVGALGDLLSEIISEFGRRFRYVFLIIVVRGRWSSKEGVEGHGGSEIVCSLQAH